MRCLQLCVFMCVCVGGRQVCNIDVPCASLLQAGSGPSQCRWNTTGWETTKTWPSWRERAGEVSGRQWEREKEKGRQRREGDREGQRELRWVGGYLIISSPSQISEPKSGRMSWPVRTDNMLDISSCLDLLHMFIIYHCSFFSPPSSLSPCVSPFLALSCAVCSLFGYKKYTVALATVEIYPEIFHILSATVELGGKWSGRRPSRFISVSKKDLSDVFVSLGMVVIRCSFGLLQKKRLGYIYQQETVFGSFEGFLPDNSLPL